MSKIGYKGVNTALASTGNYW